MLWAAEGLAGSAIVGDYCALARSLHVRPSRLRRAYGSEVSLLPRGWLASAARGGIVVVLNQAAAQKKRIAGYKSLIVITCAKQLIACALWPVTKSPHIIIQ